jgi:tetraacyldisaccharide 4'-kinase
VIGSGARFRIAHALESGAWRSPVADRLSRVWAGLAEPSRPVALPGGIRVVGVGGPTLGGSYKTPLVVALARAIADRGESVAVVAHGYGARRRVAFSKPGEARRVSPSDRPDDVGDDALLLAMALGERGAAADSSFCRSGRFAPGRNAVDVFTGARRCDVLALAATCSPLVLVDGLLQTTPERLALSILVVDAHEPWSLGSCPPRGDLRASARALEAAADVVVSVFDAAVETPRDDDSPWRLESRIAGASNGAGRTLTLASLREMRLGLVLAVARPGRIVRSLRARGIEPVETRLFSDHAVPHPAGSRGRRVDAWLTSSKCATKLGETYDGAPLFVVDHRLEVPARVVDAVLTGSVPRE